MFGHDPLLRSVVMVLSCSAAIVALFIVQLNSILFQGLPTDLSATPLENHELLVTGAYPQGSSINSSFNQVQILLVQDDPAYNPYFALNNQLGVLYSKTPINVAQANMSDVGTFLMAINKQNQSKVEALYCVTYCVGSLTEPSIHAACYDSVSSEALHNTVNGTLLTQHVYKRILSQHVPVGYNVLQLALTPPGNKSNVSFSIMECSSKRLFFVDHLGVLRTGRTLLEEDILTYVLRIAAFTNISDVLHVDLAWVTINVKGQNTFPPTFEKPDGYTFHVKEGEEGLSVGFVKAVDQDEGLSGIVIYSLAKHQDASLFQVNETSGEIKTAKALDRETAESHVFIVVVTDQGVPNNFSNQVEVRVTVDDINDNRPIFASKEYALSLNRYAELGFILELEAEDKDIGKNAEMAYAIIEGNDKGLFWINSSSGELFLVKPLTVIAIDSIKLVVEVADTFSTNTSFKDLTIVNMTVYDVSSPSSRSTSVAVIVGSSVGTILFIAVITTVALWLWKRRKSEQHKRGRHELVPEGDTTRSSSLVIYSPLAVSPIKESIIVSTKGSGSSLESIELSTEPSSWTISSLSEPSVSPAQVSRPSLVQGSQVSLDLSALDFVFFSPKHISNSEPSTPSKERRRSRGSHISLDLSGMDHESLSAPATPCARRTTKEWRHRLGSHISLDFSQLESDLFSRPQDPKKRYESPLSPASSLAVPSATRITSSHVSLDLGSVEPPQSPKRHSESSVPEFEETTVSSRTLSSSTEYIEARPAGSSSDESFESIGGSEEEFVVARHVMSSDGSLTSQDSKQSQGFQSIQSIELATLRKSTDTLPAEGKPTRSLSDDSFASIRISKEDFIAAKDDTSVVSADSLAYQELEPSESFQGRPSVSSSSGSLRSFDGSKVDSDLTRESQSYQESKRSQIFQGRPPVSSSSGSLKASDGSKVDAGSSNEDFVAAEGETSLGSAGSQSFQESKRSQSFQGRPPVSSASGSLRSPEMSKVDADLTRESKSYQESTRSQSFQGRSPVASSSGSLGSSDSSKVDAEGSYEHFVVAKDDTSLRSAGSQSFQESKRSQSFQGRPPVSSASGLLRSPEMSKVDADLTRESQSYQESTWSQSFQRSPVASSSGSLKSFDSSKVDAGSSNEDFIIAEDDTSLVSAGSQSFQESKRSQSFQGRPPVSSASGSLRSPDISKVDADLTRDSQSYQESTWSQSFQGLSPVASSSGSLGSSDSSKVDAGSSNEDFVVAEDNTSLGSAGSLSFQESKRSQRPPVSSASGSLRSPDISKVDADLTRESQSYQESTPSQSFQGMSPVASSSGSLGSSDSSKVDAGSSNEDFVVAEDDTSLGSTGSRSFQESKRSQSFQGRLPVSSESGSLRSPEISKVDADLRRESQAYQESIRSQSFQGMYPVASSSGSLGSSDSSKVDAGSSNEDFVVAEDDTSLGSAVSSSSGSLRSPDISEADADLTRESQSYQKTTRSQSFHGRSPVASSSGSLRSSDSSKVDAKSSNEDFVIAEDDTSLGSAGSQSFQESKRSQSFQGRPPVSSSSGSLRSPDIPEADADLTRESQSYQESTPSQSFQGRSPVASSSRSLRSFDSFKVDADLARDDASFTSCAESRSSLQSSESQDFLDILQTDSGDEFYSGDEESTRKSIRSSKPVNLKPVTSDQSHLQHFALLELTDNMPHEAVSLPFTGNAKAGVAEDGRQKTGQLPIQSIHQSVSLPVLHICHDISQGTETVRSETMIQTAAELPLSGESFERDELPHSPPVTLDVTKTFSVPAEVEQSPSLPIVAGTATEESETIKHESSDQAEVELFTLVVSSEGEDRLHSPLVTEDVTEIVSFPTTVEQSISLPNGAGTSIIKLETVKNETSDEAEMESLPSTQSSESDEPPRSRHVMHDVTETDSPPHNFYQSPRPSMVSIKIDKAETSMHETSDQAEALLSPSESFEGDCLSPHQESFHDLEKSRSPSPELRRIKSKIPQIPTKLKIAFRFLKPGKRRRQHSKFQQEGSSDDSDNAMELKQLTPRKRFLSLGYIKKKRSPRYHDVSSQQDSASNTVIFRSALQTPSTHQENAPVTPDQYLPSNLPSTSQGLQECKVTGTDTLAEKSTDIATGSGCSQRGTPSKDSQPKLPSQAEHFGYSSCSSSASIRSSSSSSDEDRPLRRLKPSVVSPDSNNQLTRSGGEETKNRRSSTSSAHAATAFVSQSLPPRGSSPVKPSVQATTSTFFSRWKRSVKGNSRSRNKETPAASHPPLSSLGAGSSQHTSLTWARRDHIEEPSFEECHENVADASFAELASPEVSSPRAKRQDKSDGNIATLVSSLDSLHLSGGQSDNKDASSDTNE